MAERILSRQRSIPPNKAILFAPYVTPRLAEQLAECKINFIDQAGNCHLELAPSLLIHIVGRARPIIKASFALSANGYRVLLALLAEPRLAMATVRDLALATGIGKSTAADAIKSLSNSGLLHPTHPTKKGRVSSCSCCWMYVRMTPSSLPTVETK